MAQSVSPQPRTPAPTPAQRTPTAQRSQEQQPAAAPSVAQTPSVSRRIRPEETQQDDTEEFESARLSHVRILPTSLPYVHDQLMEQRDREQRARLEERRREAARAEEDQSGSERRELTRKSRLQLLGP